MYAKTWLHLVSPPLCSTDWLNSSSWSNSSMLSLNQSGRRGWFIRRLWRYKGKWPVWGWYLSPVCLESPSENLADAETVPWLTQHNAQIWSGSLQACCWNASAPRSDTCYGLSWRLESSQLKLRMLNPQVILLLIKILIFAQIDLTIHPDAVVVNTAWPPHFNPSNPQSIITNN